MKTAELTPAGGDGIGGRARENVKQRFFLYGVDMFGDQLAVHQGVEFSTPVFPYPAQSAPSLFYPTPMRAQLALHMIFMPGIKLRLLHRDVEDATPLCSASLTIRRQPGRRSTENFKDLLKELKNPAGPGLPRLHRHRLNYRLLR